MVPDTEIQYLSVCFDTTQGPAYVVNGLPTIFRVRRISGVIGENGSDKSIMDMSLLRLLPNTARVTGKCLFGEDELHSMSPRRLRRLWGAAIGPTPQNLGASLDPAMRLRRQLTETIITHGRWKRRKAGTQAVGLLRRSSFKEPGRILNQYPFQMSGGMNQRLVPALGLTYRPGWVITDEPTKDLDAVIRNQVYSVLRQVCTGHHCNMFVITHDLALARRLRDDIRVLHTGRIIEQGMAEEVMGRPCYPCTAGLIHSLPSRDMVPISPPDPGRLEHTGCPFYPRCPRTIGRCGWEAPGEVTLPMGGRMRCFLYG